MNAFESKRHNVESVNDHYHNIDHVNDPKNTHVWNENINNFFNQRRDRQ